jgi:hypothetical protein
MGVSVELKEGQRWRKAGRPPSNISIVKYPKKKLKREKDILLQRGVSLENISGNEGKTVEENVANNITNLYKTLPHNSPFRVPLLNAVTKGVSVSKAAEYFQVHRSTIHRSRNLQTNIFLSIKAPIDATRQRLDPALVTRIQRWMLFICLPKSGDKRTIIVLIPNPAHPGTTMQEIRSRHPQRITNKAFYAWYVAEWFMMEKEDEIVSFSTFNNLKPAEIRREVWNLADDKVEECPKCASFRDLSPNLLRQAEEYQGDLTELERLPRPTRQTRNHIRQFKKKIEDIFARLKPLEDHMDIAWIQRKVYKNLKQNLGPRMLLIVQDFTKHYGKVCFATRHPKLHSETPRLELQ